LRFLAANYRSAAHSSTPLSAAQFEVKTRDLKVDCNSSPRRPPASQQDEAAPVAPPEPGRRRNMKTIGILTLVAAIFATASVADARTRNASHGYGNGYSNSYTGSDRAGGPSYGGM
jgi:ferric-dicitrate binding protein FerR (iron transport regulator)